MSNVILTSRASAVGGRDGKVASDDNVINLDLVMPGTKGKEDIPTSNPEQLFAAGYAACFDGAYNLMARQAKNESRRGRIQKSASYRMKRITV